MSFARKTQSDKRLPRISKWFSLPIGLRLSLAFMAVILLTGLIGILAIQQISSVTDKATEINARDLPESITLERLRTLFYREDDLEHSLVNGNDMVSEQPVHSMKPDALTLENVRLESSLVRQPNIPGVTPTPGTSPTPGKQTQRTVTELASVLKEIAKDCQQLLALERSEQGEDLKLAQQVSDTARKTSALSARIQTLVEQGNTAQARTLDFSQQEPLLLSAVTTVTRLSSLEQAENANDTVQTQQDSRTSILFLLALTAFCLVLSIVLRFS